MRNRCRVSAMSKIAVAGVRDAARVTARGWQSELTGDSAIRRIAPWNTRHGPRSCFRIDALICGHPEVATADGNALRNLAVAEPRRPDARAHRLRVRHVGELASRVTGRVAHDRGLRPRHTGERHRDDACQPSQSREPSERFRRKRQRAFSAVDHRVREPRYLRQQSVGEVPRRGDLRVHEIADRRCRRRCDPPRPMRRAPSASRRPRAPTT